ncbi:MAG: N-acyl homoserine lactonase family protein [Sphingomonadaceae bacterium]|nr:N-acyl homoserine lactonase family protein [Sphingomonadaceae bacterium]
MHIITRCFVAISALVFGLAAGTATAQSGPAATPAMVTMTRLDCGSIMVNNLNLFSDTQAYPGARRQLVSSCYLIRHGDTYMLWDTGLPASLIGVVREQGGAMVPAMTTRITDQLTQLGVRTDQISIIAISHRHFDHIGQLADFPNARLLIGAGDWTAIQSEGATDANAPFAHWLTGGGNADPVSGDRDIFGDGSVVMLNMPGHTAGHHSLLVRLAGMGPVLLTGDLAHFQENYDQNGVPIFNADRADTLASFDRFKALARNLGAMVIIQHEAGDVGKLPAFPAAAQ